MANSPILRRIAVYFCPSLFTISIIIIVVVVVGVIGIVVI